MLKSVILTLVQYSSVIWIVSTNTLLADNTVLVYIQLTGIALGLWAIWEMRKSKLNIAPNIRSHAILITSGPYRLIRHPMYLALLLALTPMISQNVQLDNLALFGVLYTNLIIKLEYEEKLLSRQFYAFQEYKTRSWKLFPYIY